MPSAARGIGGGLRALGTCLLVAVFCAVSGCGGDSEPDPFAAGYNAAIRQLAAVDQEVAALDVSAKSSRAIAREFDRFGDALRSTRTELADLEPPQRAAVEFEALLSALDDSVAASRRAAAAARAIEPRRQRRALRRLRAATRAVDSAQDALGRAVETTG
jgi:hypothetical protein